MTAAAKAPGFILKGWHVLIALVLFFGVDIAVNAYFIVSAYRTFPGETTLTPYEDGVAYNAALAQKRAQAALGWRVEAGQDVAQRIRVDVSDRTGAPLERLQVSAHLQRPATDAGQQTLSLTPSRAGVYLSAPVALRGAWDLEVTARDGPGRIATADRRLSLP
jgi:nitrogen fixation protein FixH